MTIMRQFPSLSFWTSVELYPSGMASMLLGYDLSVLRFILRDLPRRILQRMRLLVVPAYWRPTNGLSEK